MESKSNLKPPLIPETSLPWTRILGALAVILLCVCMAGQCSKSIQRPPQVHYNRFDTITGATVGTLRSGIQSFEFAVNEFILVLPDQKAKDQDGIISVKLEAVKVMNVLRILAEASGRPIAVHPLSPSILEAKVSITRSNVTWEEVLDDVIKNLGGFGFRKGKKGELIVLYPEALAEDYKRYLD